jgi:hypothetical protein
MRLASRPARAFLAIATTFTLTGCVESFGGSALQLDFSMPTPVPGSPSPLAPPAGTYFTFYALDHEYSDEDPDTIILTRFYEVQRFEIQPVVRAASPCFIEDEDSRYPGLHVTQYAAKERERTGITEPLDPPDGVTEADITDVLTADVRMQNLVDLENQVKAVVSYSGLVLPAPSADCVADGISPDAIPAVTCTDEADNAQRFRVCEQLWAEDPEYYEGSDKVFTLPLNGRFYGTVAGMNPINQGFLGGSSMFVDENIAGYDAYAINWQYEDEAMQTSDIGTTFMVGTPELRTRGVINAHLAHPDSASTFCEVAVFADLGEDDVNF